MNIFTYNCIMKFNVLQICDGADLKHQPIIARQY